MKYEQHREDEQFRNLRVAETWGYACAKMRDEARGYAEGVIATLEDHKGILVINLRYLPENLMLWSEVERMLTNAWVHQACESDDVWVRLDGDEIDVMSSPRLVS